MKRMILETNDIRIKCYVKMMLYETIVIRMGWSCSLS